MTASPVLVEENATEQDPFPLVVHVFGFVEPFEVENVTKTPGLKSESNTFVSDDWPVTINNGSCEIERNGGGDNAKLEARFASTVPKPVIIFGQIKYVSSMHFAV